ncbi:MAG TPA: HlyD family secretion protein [Myxococcales bacterium]|jgi:membrane fusion protein (multidrug efflux system)|nr:HlyD family secretion protein [Myxococcales bacterium]
MSEHGEEGRREGNGGARPGQKPEVPAESPEKKRQKRIRIAAGVAVVGVAALLWWLHARNFEDTDDAQIDGYITAVSSRVPGTVMKVLVEDNQLVKQGDPLVELDTTDLDVAVAQARAAVAQAEASLQAEQPNVSITATSNRTTVQAAEDEVSNTQAELEAARRDLDQADANNRYAQQQKERAAQLLASKTVPQAEYDQRVSAADVAQAAVGSARQRVDQRKAKLQTAQSRLVEARANAPRQLVAREAGLSVRQANLELARAQLRQAELGLGYAKVAAPVSGVIGKRSVNVGDRVQPGQQLMSITQTGDLWVTANFRETQIDRMQAGQKVTVHVDAIDRDYQGTVASFAGATGSRYSLLPPENATGNYVKVVQRIPVRINLDPKQPAMERLRPGMSVEPKVRVR